MTRLEQEVQQNPSINWEKVKEVLCGIESTLKVICDELPNGLVKVIICGIVAVLSIICKNL